MDEVPGRVVSLIVAIVIAALVLGVGLELLNSAGDAAGCNTVTQRILSQVADVVGSGAGIC